MIKSHKNINWNQIFFDPYPGIKKLSFTISIVIFTVFSCNNTENQNNSSNFQPVITKAITRKKKSERTNTSKVILSGIPRKVKARIESINLTNTNVKLARIAKISPIGKLQINTPGQDSFLTPKNINVIENKVLASKPEIILAKDPTSHDQNPQSFSFYSKLQGLAHNIFRCLLQDSKGNLWFGSYGGGATKFDGKYFVHYSVNEGLCNNYIYSMLEDNQGNIWFGTDGGGISKFDGKYFTNLTTNTEEDNNRITSILQDKNANIWFGTKGSGIIKFDGKNYTQYTEKQGLSNNDVLSLFRDKKDNIWIGTDGGGALRFDYKSFTCFTQKDGLANDRVQCICEDKKNNIWFGTNGGGISNFDGHFISTFNKNQGLIDNNIYYMLSDRFGDLWIGSDGGGITKYDGKNFTFFGKEEGLSNESITYILQERSGNLWFATFGGGVAEYQGNCFTHYTESEGLSNNDIYGVYSDNKGIVWLGPTGGGILKFDGKSFTNIKPENDLFDATVLCIIQDKSGNFWLGTNGKGLLKYDGQEFSVYTEKEGLSNNYVFCMANDKSGNIWLGTYGGGLIKFDGKSFTNYTDKEGLVSNYISCVFPDNDGNIWSSSFGGGISKYDGKTFTNYTDKEGLPNNYVYSIIQDNSGNLWLGTNGNGAVKFDGKYFTQYSEKEGLSNNAVLCMLKDQKGNLWFGTRRGLNKLNLENLNRLNHIRDSFDNEQTVFFKTYNYEDGFLGIGCSRGSISEDKSGNIWIGANEKLTVYHPCDDLIDTIIPKVALTRVEIFNENLTWTKLENKKDTIIELGNGLNIGNFKFYGTSKWYGLPINLSLKHNNNFLNFRFIAITQNQSKKVKFIYKLEGLDKNWSAPNIRDEAAYGNIPPGTYFFKVKAMNGAGIWSKEFSYKFTIRSPWWATWWFRSFLIICIIVSLISFYRWRVTKLREQKKNLEQIVKEKNIEVINQNKELKSLYEEQQTLNEELSETIDELNTTNDELYKQQQELEQTLNTLKATQKQLIQSEKMASLGVLAAGVAHEINNPLNFIQGGIFGLEYYLNENLHDHLSDINPIIDIMQVGVSRAASIVTSLNNYSRQNNDKKEKCNIYHIIENCLVILQNQINGRIIVNKDYATEPTGFYGIESKLHQAMLNILTNSVQAIDNEGTISISTTVEEFRICITIEDSGCGISPENLIKIFDPFFTTKDPGKGTGLGLSITFNIIKEHDGEISYKSKLGEGTTVSIKFPIQNQ